MWLLEKKKGAVALGMIFRTIGSIDRRVGRCTLCIQYIIEFPSLQLMVAPSTSEDSMLL
jgi:hypothetical protein